MKVDISTKDLSDWLPHRAPMVWVDRVTEVEEGGGRAELSLDKASHAFDGQGRLRQSSLVEFCAQAYGFVRAAEEYAKDIPAPKVNQAFLAGVNQIKWGEEEIPSTGTLEILVKTTRQVGPLSLCRAQVFHQSREVVSLTLKLFANAERD